MLTAFVALLGPQAQAVTFSLALLEKRRVVMDELVVIHTTTKREPIHSAYTRLAAVLQQERPLLRVSWHLVQEKNQTFDDVTTEDAARAYLTTLYRALLALKQRGALVHLNMTGVRKLMTIYAMTAAQLLFDQDDHLWHLHTARTVIEKGHLWPQAGDETTLVEVPVLRWSAVAPVLTRLGHMDDPWDAVRAQQEQQRRNAIHRAALFVEHTLTPAERDVARLVVIEGLSNAGIASRLQKTEKTVVHQMSSILRKLAEEFELAPDVVHDRTTVLRLLSAYFLLR
jgi:CRISPR-associated protein (TIGR02584 family)